MAGAHIPRFIVLSAALLAAACQSGAEAPRLKSDYVGRTTAEFFTAYGPPDEVIAFEQELKTDSTGRVLQSADPKELVYYWSSGGKSGSKAPASKAQACNLAILSSAGGKILLIEAQDEDGNIEAAKARCAAIVR